MPVLLCQEVGAKEDEDRKIKEAVTKNIKEKKKKN